MNLCAYLLRCLCRYLANHTLAGNNFLHNRLGKAAVGNELFNWGSMKELHTIYYK